MTIYIPAWVDGTLTPVEKLQAHQEGLRHKAISVFLFHQDRLLIQRRALSKYHTPGLWANTCCTHPKWDEPAQDAAQRRLKEELGITCDTLSNCGQVEYRASVGDGMIEHEVVEMFIGHVAQIPDMRPNPEEVCDTQWMGREALLDRVQRHPEQFTVWFKIYLEQHQDRFWPSPCLS